MTKPTQFRLFTQPCAPTATMYSMPLDEAYGYLNFLMGEGMLDEEDVAGLSDAEVIKLSERLAEEADHYANEEGKDE